MLAFFSSTFPDLSQTMSVVWPREVRGKWFGQFLAGTTLTICNGGRLFDILKGDYMDAVYYIIRSTMNEYFINDMLSELQTMHDRHFHIVNPPCFAAYKGYERSLAFLCKGIIRNANAFWTSLKFCLWLFLALGVVSHLLSKYFLRMVNYTYDGSEVESFTAVLQQRYALGQICRGKTFFLEDEPAVEPRGKQAAITNSSEARLARSGETPREKGSHVCPPRAGPAGFRLNPPKSSERLFSDPDRDLERELFLNDQWNTSVLVLIAQ
ncbi:hypothetical protein HPB47_025003 [Ixodes persulcatus]|uniref:Uncharacterized protein n=1 Tax=Ixodes persulcatus TaxID=34615 RepID=A0AC60Q3X2_IXOPE|nr:hypothetical protein HPB47_025003 [Ixodes persulcatus]